MHLDHTLALIIKGDKGSRMGIDSPVSGKFESFSDIINRAIPFIFAFAGVGLLLMIISAGFTLLTSAGDPKKMETGKSRLTYAIVGFIIIFIAYWIVQIVGAMFGIDAIKQIF